MKIISQDEGVWGCTFVGYCSEVCPKGVDPAAAIQLAGRERQGLHDRHVQARLRPGVRP